MKHITGSDLRAMRRVAGHTTMFMAKAAGVKTRKTYENWEKNIGTPSVNQFLAMVASCGFKPSEIISHYEEDSSQADRSLKLLISRDRHGQ